MGRLLIRVVVVSVSNRAGLTIEVSTGIVFSCMMSMHMP